MKRRFLHLAIAAMLLPMCMMAQTYHFAVVDGLKYIYEEGKDPSDSTLFIWVAGSGNLSVDGETVTAGYFFGDGNLRPTWRRAYNSDENKFYKSVLDTITSIGYNGGTSTTATTYKGVEYFRNLKKLMINSANRSVTLDLSKNTQLTTLEFTNPTSTSSVRLTTLDISNTQLTSLTIPAGSHTYLQTFTAENSKLTSLNVSACTALKTLNLKDCASLTALTLPTTKTILKTLDIIGTGLTSLNVSAYTNLDQVAFTHTTLPIANLTIPSTMQVLQTGSTTSVAINGNPTTLTLDVTNWDNRDVDLSGFTSLKTLYLTGATSLVLPPNRTEFDLTVNGNPDLVVDFSNQNQLQTLRCAGDAPINLDVSNLPALKELNVNGCTNLAKLNASHTPLTSYDHASSIEDLDLSYTDLTFATNNSMHFDSKVSSFHLAAKLKKVNVSHCLNLTTDFSPPGVHLDTLIADSCVNLQKITLATGTDDNNVSYISVKDCTNLQKIIAHRNKLTSLDFLSPLLDAGNNFTQIQVNGGPPNDGTTVITEPSNVIREVDSSKLPATMEILLVRHNIIEKMNLENLPNISQLEANNNRLWALNLECFTNARSVNVGGQRTFAEAQIVKGSDPSGQKDTIKIRIPLPENVTMHLNRIDTLTIGDQLYTGTEAIGQRLKKDNDGYYFDIPFPGNGKDINLYGKGIRYIYDTMAMTALGDTPTTEQQENAAAVAKTRKMDVNVSIDPYILNINQNSMSGEGVDYYSGTICLDYDAIVPAGTKVYIAKRVKCHKAIEEGGDSTINAQLDLELVGEEGDTIPAGLALYVKSETAAGLYAFHKTWEPDYIGWIGKRFEETLAYNKIKKINPNTGNPYTNTKNIHPDTLALNILTGTQEKMAKPAGKIVLTLGRQQVKRHRVNINGKDTLVASNMIGFWPYMGSEIPAHRCYILYDDLREDDKKALQQSNSNVNSSNGKGALFSFSDEENGTITEIKTVEQKPVNKSRKEGWYTLQGVRIGYRPTKSGVYIYNGRKVIIQ